jgi:hypothetical protein
MDIRRRFADVVLAAGAVCVVVSTLLLGRYRDPVGELPWLVAMGALHRGGDVHLAQAS